MIYHLNTTEGTWSSVELLKAVSLGYIIDEIYEQHHFEDKSNTLFHNYNKLFFDITRKAKLEGNKRLEAIAKMFLNGVTGKWRF